MKRSNRFLSLCLVFTMVLCAYSMVTKEVTAASDYTTWKQYDSRWGSKTVGKNGTMASWGCKITTLAILMVHSGVENENKLEGALEKSLFLDWFIWGNHVNHRSKAGGFYQLGFGFGRNKKCVRQSIFIV